MTSLIETLKKSLAIANLIEKKKPETLQEAKGTLVDIQTDELGRPIDDLGRLIADE